MSDRTQTLSVELERADVDRLSSVAPHLRRNVMDNDAAEFWRRIGSATRKALLSQPEDEGWSAPKASIDAAWRAVEELDGHPPIHRNVLALAVSAAFDAAPQPPAPALSDEERERLVEIADAIDQRGLGDDDLGLSADEAAAFLRNLASREHRGEEGVERGPAWARMCQQCAIRRHDRCEETGKDGGPCNCSCRGALKKQPPAGEAAKLRERLQAEIEERRDWAAERRDLATKSPRYGGRHLVKARWIDADTDRLQALLDSAPSDSRVDLGPESAGLKVAANSAREKAAALKGDSDAR